MAALLLPPNHARVTDGRAAHEMSARRAIWTVGSQTNTAVGPHQHMSGPNLADVMHPAQIEARVLGSQAFNRARREAADVVKSPERLRALLDEVEAMARENPSLSTGSQALDLDIVFAVVEAALDEEAEIHSVPDDSAGRARPLNVTADARMRLVVAALLYLVDPDDLIPDDQPYGLVDDLAILRWASRVAREELPVPKESLPLDERRRAQG